MGVGHAAVALTSARLAPRVNAGWLIFAALLADFLLGVFAALGMEQVHVPPDFIVLLTAATWSPLLSTTPPTPAQLIPGWIAMPVVFSALVYWLDRRRVRAGALTGQLSTMSWAGATPSGARFPPGSP